MHASNTDEVTQFIKEIQAYPKPTTAAKAPSGKSAQKKANNANAGNKGGGGGGKGKGGGNAKK